MELHNITLQSPNSFGFKQPDPVKAKWQRIGNKRYWFGNGDQEKRTVLPENVKSQPTRTIGLEDFKESTKPTNWAAYG